MRISLLSFFISSIQGWGPESHRVIAKIASIYMKDSTRLFLASEFGVAIEKLDRTLMEAAVFPDSVAEVTGTGPYHYAFTPYRDCSTPFDITRDCGADQSGVCIVSALADFTLDAMSPELPLATRKNALTFILHLLGDIHNPMHLGFQDDVGGNLIALANQKSLHEIWDSDIVKERKRQLLDESDEDELHPWSLSVALLTELESTAQDFFLDLTRDAFMTRESAIGIAARMATDTSMEYTCEVAYKNETGVFFENGDGISPVYMLERSVKAGELLKKAGVRLAEYMNIIASVYNSRKQLARKKPIENPKPVVDQNPFYYLDIDFDPEALLYNEESQENTGSKDEVLESGEAIRPDVSTPSARSVEERKRERARKKRQNKKLRAKLFEGVDIEKIVLIKRRGMLLVTRVDLVTETYFANLFDVIQVVFKGNSDGKPMLFLFDSACFGTGSPSAEMINRALYKIRDLPYTSEITSFGDEIKSAQRVVVKVPDFASQLPAEGGDLMMVGSGDEASIRARVAAQLGWHDEDDSEQGEHDKMKSKTAKRLRAKLNKGLRKRFDGNLPTRDQLWASDFEKQLDHICAYQIDRVMMFVHEDTLKDQTGKKMRFYKYEARDPNFMDHPVFLLIDCNIYNGGLTPEINSMLHSVEARNAALIDQMKTVRRTLEAEMDDINTIFFGTDPNRLRRVKTINTFSGIEFDEGKSCNIFEWQIRRFP
jgi:hypothetical protein